MRIDDLDTVAAALGVLARAPARSCCWPTTGAARSRSAGRCGWSTGATARRLGGIVLGNTAVHQPAVLGPACADPARPGPAAADGWSTQTTPTFVRGTTALSRPALPRPVRDDLAAPYRGAARRQSVGDFVADIPFEHDHPCRATLDASPPGLNRLADVPVLLLWGARDPVFTERHLADLLVPAAARRRPALSARLAPGHRGRAGSAPSSPGPGSVPLDRPRPVVEVTVASAGGRRRPAGHRRSAVVGPRRRSRFDGSGGQPADPASVAVLELAPGLRAPYGLLRLARPAGRGSRRRTGRQRCPPGRPGRAADPARHRSDRRRLRLLAGRRSDRGLRRRPRAALARRRVAFGGP